MRVHSVGRVVLLHGGAKHVGVDGLGMHGQVVERNRDMHVRDGLHKLRVGGLGGDSRLVGAEPTPSRWEGVRGGGVVRRWWRRLRVELERCCGRL